MEAKSQMRYAGVAKRDLPASLVCQRTGLVAGTDDNCACDACLWVAAMKSAEFEGEEREADE